MMQGIAEAEEQEANEARQSKQSGGNKKSHSGASDVTMEGVIDEDSRYEDFDRYEDFGRYEDLVS